MLRSSYLFTSKKMNMEQMLANAKNMVNSLSK
jgi:hypothetical protein